VGAVSAPFAIEVAAAGASLVAGTESGDAWTARRYDGGMLVAVIDGLGHGPEAARASRRAVEVLDAHPSESPAALIERCHAALRSTRGAVMTIASIGAYGQLTWIGVGNVDAILVPKDASRRRESVLLRGGIVGLRLPPLREQTVPLARGDTLVLATDGVRGQFADGFRPTETAAANAEAILSHYRKSSDDALVVVARVLEEAP
jgi:hypothetical protein